MKGKIYALTSTGDSEKSFLDLRFGKCEYLVLFNNKQNEFAVEKNIFSEGKNRGIRLVDFLIEQGVSTIITGEVGPKVSAYLEEKKIQLVLLEEERIRIEEVMDRIVG